MEGKNLESIVGDRIKSQVIAEAVVEYAHKLKAKYMRVYPQDLSYILGVSIPSVRRYADLLGIEFDCERDDRKKGKYIHRNLKKLKTSVYELMARKYAPIIKKAIVNGIESMESLEQKLGLSSSTIETVAKYSNIKLPKGKRGRKLGVFKRKPKVDRMIQQGISAPKIAKKVGCTPQNIYIYIRTSGQKKRWREIRDAYFEKQHPAMKQTALANISGLVYGSMYNKAVEQGNLPYQRALEYKFGKMRRKIPIEKLVKLFEEYYRAIDQREKVTYMGLARIAGTSYSNVRQVFSALDLGHRQHLKQTMTRITKEQRAQMNRILKLDISIPDAADLLGLPRYVVSVYLRKIRAAPKKGAKPLKQFCFYPGDSEALTIRKAVQIYEAKDAGFKLDEILEYTGYREEVVSDALKNRKEYEAKIISAWNYLTGKKHTKPYA